MTASTLQLTERQIRTAFATHARRMEAMQVLYLGSHVSIRLTPDKAASVHYDRLVDGCWALNLEYVQKDLEDKPYSSPQQPTIGYLNVALRRSDLSLQRSARTVRGKAPDGYIRVKGAMNASATARANASKAMTAA